jgi:membrane-bound lytic murein transglycosylase
MSAELEETRARVDEIKGECAVKAKQLVVGISNAPVDLGMLHIQGSPQCVKSA